MPNVPSAEEQLLRQNVSDVVNRNSNLGSNNPFKGPTARSLFYDAGRRNPSKYGQFLFYALGNNDNNFVDAYYKSENAQYNRNVSSLKSKNPSAGYLVRETSTLEALSASSTGTLSGLVSNFEKNIVGGLSAPYYWKDFLYCRYYGAIPNNYMITLRRFPTPVLDNLSIPDSIKSTEAYRTQGAGRPVAQAVTWFGGDTGNALSSLIEFTTGLEWTSRTQSDIIEQEAFSKGFFNDLPFQWFSQAARSATGTDALSNGLNIIGEAAVIGFDPNNTSVENQRLRGLRDRAKEGTMGLLSEYLWVPMDVVKDTQVRSSGLKFSWSGLTVVFEYDLTSVGEVNTKAAMLDILGNLLSIGTNYGNFLTPDVRYQSNFAGIGFPGGDAGLALFYKDPLSFLLSYGDKIVNPKGDAIKSAQDAQITGQINPSDSSNGAFDSEVADLKAQLSKISEDGISIDKIKDLAKKFPAAFGRILQGVVTPDFLGKYQASASLLTGAPIGEWHLSIGNPCNPIAMIGNLICDDVKIEFGDALGPDDFPTTLKATFSLQHARARERGEIESIFNRGDGRLYQTTLSTSSSSQSYSSFADTSGNILSEQTKDNILNFNFYKSGLSDQQAPNQ
jgi:hypothetical protein